MIGTHLISVAYLRVRPLHRVIHPMPVSAGRFASRQTEGGSLPPSSAGIRRLELLARRAVRAVLRMRHRVVSFGLLVLGRMSLPNKVAAPNRSGPIQRGFAFQRHRRPAPVGELFR